MIINMKRSAKSLLYRVLLLSLIGTSSLSAQWVFAAEAGRDSVQGYIVLILQFINFVLIPFLFSIALLFFLINAARYFILKGANESDREKARTLALYGIGAFVILVSFWGIVNMFVSSLRIADTEARCPDYLGDWCENRWEPGGSFYLDI